MFQSTPIQFPFSLFPLFDLLTEWINRFVSTALFEPLNFIDITRSTSFIIDSLFLKAKMSYYNFNDGAKKIAAVLSCEEGVTLFVS